MGKSSPSLSLHARIRVAIYLRVSDPRATDKFGMEAQETECRAHAARQPGWEVVAIFKDWQTGTELFARTEMTRCREAMRRREFDVLLVDRLDRLSRKSHHQGFVRTEAESAGVLVASATQDLSNPIMVGVYGGISEANRDDLVRNMARGKRQKVANGLPLGSGRPPFGLMWRTETQALANGAATVRKVGYAPDPAAIRFLERIFRDYDCGESLRSLAVALEGEGVRPPYFDRTGSLRWHTTTIARILADPIYVGEAVAFRSAWTQQQQPDGPSRRHGTSRAEEERVPLPAGTAPVVVDPAFFARVQRRLDANKRESCRRDRDPEVGILRRGYAVCGACGHPLTVVTPKDPHRQPYYRCNATKRRWACDGSGAMGCDDLDEALWARLLADLSDEERVRVGLKDPDDGAEGLANDLATMDRQLAQIERQQRNLADAVAALADNADGAAPLVAKLAELGRQRRTVETEREAMRARRDARAVRVEQRRAIADGCDLIAARMLQVTGYAGRRAMIELLDVKVSLWPKGQTPRWTYASLITPGLVSGRVYDSSRPQECQSKHP